MVHLFRPGDCDPTVLKFDLAHVQLTGKGCDMRVGRDAPQLELVCLDGKLILGRDDAPRMEVLDHLLNALFFVTDVVLLHICHILRFDGRNDGFNRHGIHHLLEGLFLPVFPLGTEEACTPWCPTQFLGLGAQAFRCACSLVYGFSATRRILVSVRTIRRKPCLPPSFGGCKMACEGRKLSKKVSTDLRVGYPKIALSGTASVLPLIVLVMAITVAVIDAMVAPLLHQ